jgi:hypothetical protein
MIRMAAVGRVVLKTTAWLLIGILAFGAVWYAANRLLEPPIDGVLTDPLFSQANPIPDSQNAAIAILGITAPGRTDFVKHGARVKALYEANAPHGQILEALQGAKSLQPTVESAQVTCWLDPDWPAMDECLPFEKAPEILRANSELLDRMRAVHALRSYANTVPYVNQSYLTLAKLSVAEMQAELRKGDTEEAYQKWKAQFNSTRMMVRGTDSWVGRAVGLVAIGMTLPVLEKILNADPGIAKEHATELYQLVQPSGIDAFNPEGIVRGESALLKDVLSRLGDEKESSYNYRLYWLVEHMGQKNRILNRYAMFAPEYASAMRMPWKELNGEYERLRKKYYEPEGWEMVLDPFGSVFFAVHIDSQLKAREMVRQMHYLDGKLRLATLVLQQINAGVDDDGIVEFLAAAGPELRDPFSGQPMQWDPKDRKIYMTDPDERCSVMAWFRLPAPRGTPRPSGSAVSTNAC